MSTMNKRKRKGSSEYVRQIEDLTRSLRSARGKCDFKAMANIHNQIGNLYRFMGNYEEALENHQEEVELSQKLTGRDRIGLAVAYRNLGEVYIDMKEEFKAIPHIKKYLKIAQEEGNLVEEQRAHITLGRMYLSMADNDDDDGEEHTSFDREHCLNNAEKEFHKGYNILDEHELRSQLRERDVEEMRCGACQNIGICLDLKEKWTESAQWLSKAVDVGKTNDFHEYLHPSCCALSSVFTKLKKHKEARRAVQEGLKSAKALGNSNMEMECILQDAKILFLFDDGSGLEAGKKILKRLRKRILTQNSARAFLDELDPLLKAAVSICAKEDEVYSTPQTDHNRLMELHESLGDNYASLNNFSVAAKHYEDSIKFAQLTKVTEKKMSRLYYSLAATYKDNCEWENAVKYFRKEIEFHEENVVEAFRTQTNITLSLEKVNKYRTEELQQEHQKAIALAKKTGNPKCELTAYNNLGLYLKSIGHTEESEKMLSKVAEIKTVHNLEDLDDPEGESQDILDDDDVDLDNLSSDDESDVEEDNPDRKPNNEVGGKRKKAVKVNEVGETKLHVAAKKGDLKAVRRLLRQGHEVNPRDSAGWLPIHEACNFGHSECVVELLKNGAWMNDPGGEKCEQVTPLHDAAVNGHFEVVQVLLDHGSNVLAKDSSRNYPIDSLIDFKERYDGPMDEACLAQYNKLYNHIVSLMEQRGKRYSRKTKKTKKPQDEPNTVFSLSGIGEDAIPVRITIDDFDPDDGDAAVDMYSETIKSLRNRKNKSRPKDFSRRDNPIMSVPEALIPESQNVVEDWLLEDIPKASTSSKRKRDPFDDVPLKDNAPTRRKKDTKRRPRDSVVSNNELSPLRFNVEDVMHSSPTNDTIVRSQSGRSSLQDLSDEDSNPRSDIADSGDDFSIISIKRPKSNEGVFHSKSSSLSKQPKARVVQTRLPFKIVSAKTAINVSSDSDSPSPPRASTSRGFQRSNTTTNRCDGNRKPLVAAGIRLKIHVMEHVLLVPIDQEHMNATIDWLCQECSTRYFRSHGVRPILTLSTMDGALLSAEDTVYLSIGTETELLANVKSFDLPPIQQRFKTACVEAGISCEAEDLEFELQMCQSSNCLRVFDCFLRGKLIVALSQSLKRNFELTELILCGCSLFDQGVQELCNVVPTLPNLLTLDLSNNGISYTGFEKLVQTFSEASYSLPNNKSASLQNITLSYNPLGDSVGDLLATLLHRFTQLKSLCIADCNLTMRLFASNRADFTAALKTSKLETLDISYNDWTEVGIEKILQHLNSSRIHHLNLSSCNVSDGDAFVRILNNFMSRSVELPFLRELILSDCSITDISLRQLTDNFARLLSLETLCLSCNYLTISSGVEILDKSLECSIPLRHLDMSCPTLWSEKVLPTRLLLALERKLQSAHKLNFLKLTSDAGMSSEFLGQTDDNSKPIMSEIEHRICRIWEEYAPVNSVVYKRQGNSFVLEM